MKVHFQGHSLFIVVILFFYSALSQGDSSCSSIDLTEQGGSMAQMAPMNQLGSDLCYAYVTSQMIDAYRSSIGINISGENARTSPTLLAVENTLAQSHEQERRLRDPRFGAVDGGRVVDAFNTFSQRGACTMAVDNQFTSNAGKPDGDAHPFDLLMAEIELQNVLPSVEELRDNDAIVSFCQGLQTLMGQLNEQINPKAISEITHQLLAGAYITDRYCRGDNRINLSSGQMPELVSISHIPDYLNDGSRRRGQNPDFYQQNLDSLDQGICSGQPVSISYCSQMAVDPRFRMMNENGQTLNDLPEDQQRSGGILSRLRRPGHPGGPAPHVCGLDSPDNGGGKHVSLIVGRRVNRNGQVEYRLRNTWGRYCHERRLHLDNCEANGDHWVSADQIKANITEIQYLQR